MAHTHHRARFTGFPVAAPFGELFARLTAWNDARRTRDALSRLSVHELDDIGLTRADIDRIANRRF